MSTEALRVRQAFVIRGAKWRRKKFCIRDCI